MRSPNDYESAMFLSRDDLTLLILALEALPPTPVRSKIREILISEFKTMLFAMRYHASS